VHRQQEPPLFRKVSGGQVTSKKQRMSRTKQIARKTVGEKVYQKHPVPRVIRRRRALTNVEMEELKKDSEETETEKEDGEKELQKKDLEEDGEEKNREYHWHQRRYEKLLRMMKRILLKLDVMMSVVSDGDESDESDIVLSDVE
jgi:hypothetical protein